MSGRILGLALAGLVGGACALAWLPGSGLVPRAGGTVVRSAPGFLVILVLAYAVYVVAVIVAPRIDRRSALRFGALIQCVPLAAPLLLSTDAWSYWAYGWLANADSNPYAVAPSAVSGNPALPHMGADWRDTTSVYGPLFTFASQLVARVVGGNEDAAAWAFKLLAAAAVVGAMHLVASGGRATSGSRAAVLVGWNPLVAVHAAGGGHNDAIVGLLVAAALVTVAHRGAAAGAAWVAAIFVKWVAAPLLVLEFLAARRSRARMVVGVTAAGVATGTAAVWRFGTEWLGVVEPLADNAARTTSFSLAARLGQLGVPEGAALAVSVVLALLLFLALVRRARGGDARPGVLAVGLLATSPYLAAWYLAWVMPAAACDDRDPWAWVGGLVLGAYLLPHAIPV